MADLGEPECGICTEDYQPSNRVMRTPCGHNLCDPCLQKITKNGVALCPFCRKEFVTPDCKENLKLQEVSNTLAASKLKYPFDQASCSTCGESAAFADLFVCYSCHPSLMQNVLDFEPKKMAEMLICIVCEGKHRPFHPEEQCPVSTLPITIYTTNNLSEMEDLAVRIFHSYKIDKFTAPFAVGLIHCVLARRTEPKLSQSLLHFLADTSLEFLDFIVKKAKWKDVRMAGRLFLKSYWPILKILADLPSSAFSTIDFVKPMMTAVERAAKAAFLVQDEERHDKLPYLARVAVEAYVWDKCSPILDAIWRQVLAIDTSQMGGSRTEAMMQLLSICRHVFENTDTVDFLDEIVGNERMEIRSALDLPHLTNSAYEQLADYEEQMEQEFEMIDLQGVDRHIKMSDAGRRHVVGDTS